MKHLRKTIVYGLVDPETGDIMYVGRTVDPYKRMGQHLKARSNSHRDRWIKSLQNRGLEPTMIVLDVLERDRDSERIWILGLGVDRELLNSTLPGGRLTQRQRKKVEPEPRVMQSW